MKEKIAILMCWLITIIMLLNANNQIEKIECITDKFEQASQLLLIDSLYTEIMDLGARLDSMYIKYD